ncbi:MAG: AI-2E family transporter, partial [Saprospiraceae bacterium]|nr:AI-2E family transporter [Saprospiraceae bacterium]
FLIFLLNFIPSIGSIVGTALPALFSLLQYQDGSRFLLVLLSISAIQLLVGNYLDPRMLGRSLNISPFVVLFSLALWGAIWGIIGMFLSVPIMVILVIILSEFPSSRPFAILLSEKGRIFKDKGEAN